MNIIDAELNPYLVYCLCNEKAANEIRVENFCSRVAKYHELELITDGYGTMKVNDTMNKFQQGDLFYYPPNTKITASTSYGHIRILFDPYFKEMNIAEYEKSRKALTNDENYEIKIRKEPLPLPSHIKADNFNFYKSVIKKISSDFIRNGNTLDGKIVFLQLLSQLKEEFFKAYNINSINTKNYYKKIIQCTKSIAEAPEADYSLMKLVKETGLSKTSLCSAFKEITGSTIFSYIQSKRIDKAKAMLIETASSIEEIAHMCGFQNMSYFYRTFKRYARMSPANYRQNYSV